MIDVSIKDIGPIEEEFSYCMEEPGVHVLCGSQGAGKTTILRTVQLVTDGKADQKPRKRDGAKIGMASVGGKTIKIGRVVREEGELDIEGLGELDLNMLHSPKYKEPVTRDEYRIKTLARLAGAAADPSLFHGLLGGEEQFRALIDAEAIATDDLVEMSAKVKRCIEKLALSEEKAAETLGARSQAMSAQTVNVDLKAPHDEHALSQQLTDAVARLSRMEQQKADGEAIKSDAAHARKELDAVPLPDMESLEQRVRYAVEDARAKAARVDELERLLSEARSELGVANLKVESARADVESSRQYADLAAQWRETIEKAEGATVPSDDEMSEAQAAVESARAAVETGMKVRAARKAHEESQEWRSKADQHATRASSYRAAAKQTADVVSQAIGRLEDCPLSVRHDEDGIARLVIATDRSAHEPFDELSDGERWKVILPLAFKRNRVVVLSQAAFGEISPSNRALIDMLAREHGCYVLTAQVDDGELRGLPFSKMAA